MTDIGGDRRWRLLDTDMAPGPFTAALDESIARARSAGQVPDTLHFYRRRPPAVTVGYSLEAAEEVDLDYCKRRGIDVVRRLSGGGAIYTDDRQLVYSFATKDVLPSRVEDSMALVCRALAKAIVSLGAPAVFLTPNDVLVNGRKVSGSAQLRKWGVVLQHGTVLVDADPEEMFRALLVRGKGLKRHSLENPRGRITTLRAELGRTVAMEEVKAAVKNAFEEAFGALLAPGRPTPGEMALADELSRTKYGNDGWNLRREPRAP